MKRRHFLSWLSFSTLMTLLPTALSACSDTSTDLSQEASETPNKLTSQRQDGLIKVGQMKDLESSGNLSFKSPEGQNILIVQDASSSELHAIDSICTHQGCAVNWDAKALSLICPCHGSKFDSQGSVLAGPA